MDDDAAAPGSPLEVVSSPRGQKRCRGDFSLGSDDGGAGAAEEGVNASADAMIFGDEAPTEGTHHAVDPEQPSEDVIADFSVHNIWATGASTAGHQEEEEEEEEEIDTTLRFPEFPLSSDAYYYRFLTAPPRGDFWTSPATGGPAGSTSPPRCSCHGRRFVSAPRIDEPPASQGHVMDFLDDAADEPAGFAAPAAPMMSSGVFYYGTSPGPMPFVITRTIVPPAYAAGSFDVPDLNQPAASTWDDVPDPDQPAASTGDDVPDPDQPAASTGDDVPDPNQPAASTGDDVPDPNQPAVAVANEGLFVIAPDKDQPPPSKRPFIDFLGVGRT